MAEEFRSKWRDFSPTRPTSGVSKVSEAPFDTFDTPIPRVCRTICVLVRLSSDPLVAVLITRPASPVDMPGTARLAAGAANVKRLTGRCGLLERKHRGPYWQSSTDHRRPAKKQ